ncbi:MAG: hypothetical protein ACREGJ_02790 [Candidatus Saccharimonadales bacterium]
MPTADELQQEAMRKAEDARQMRMSSARQRIADVERQINQVQSERQSMIRAHQQQMTELDAQVAQLERQRQQAQQELNDASAMGPQV